MQQRGLEWVYRLTQEPRRLWKRYAYNNPMFLGLAFLQMTGLKKFSDD
jgi:UDP-N-acetyl-D-mannosaminuronic acid transferase (WecB/TagA/CpsF family)